MIFVDYLCKTGNNLFQYAFGRILSEEMNYKLVFNKNYEFDSRKPTIIFNPLNEFKNAVEIDGDINKNMIFVTNDSFGYDINNLIKLKKGIHAHGWFQRTQYYINHLDKIKDWFYLDPHVNNYNINKNDIVLCVRRGDHRGTIHCIDMEYYHRILDNIKYDRLFVCGDEYDEEVKKSLEKYNPIYYREDRSFIPLNKNTYLDDFKFIKSFNRIIIANSTYFWWAAVLSNADEIYCPNTTNPKAFFNEDQSLFMPNFIIVDNVKTN